jgi:hypothetical protein
MKRVNFKHSWSRGRCGGPDANGAITLWNPRRSACSATPRPRRWQVARHHHPQRQQQRHWDGYNKTMENRQTRYGNDVLRVPAVHKDGHTLSIAFTVPCCIRRTARCAIGRWCATNRSVRGGAGAAQAPDGTGEPSAADPGQ